MDFKLFATVFATVFLAGIADKTRIATLLFASNAGRQKLTAFFGSALALFLESAIAVTVGDSLSHWISPKDMFWLAGTSFIGIGIWILAKT